MVKTLTKDDESRVLEIDKGIKNKFKWQWLEKTVTFEVKIGKETQTVTESLASFIKKVETPGKALCVYCNDLISYGSRGCVAFVEHAKFKKHAQKVADRRSNYSLGSAFTKRKDTGETSTKDVTSWGTLARPTSTTSTNENNAESSETVPFTPIADRQAHSEVLQCFYVLI